MTPGDRHAVERSTPFPVRVLIGDGCDMPHFDDGQFAICHSNSTIEHVGGLQRMMAFAREIQRVSKSFYIQTPYLWFPIEPHFNVPFFGWLPPPTRAQLTTRFSVGKKGKFADFAEAAAFADHCQMIDMFMMKALFPNATIHHERVALLTKSLIAVRDRFD
ncbi:MAG: methyltransferase domain-containing protein [Alphaproteobacteria bacterium]|nr:methyltransferase domain-containing protein [Alphaproteobacteria bacterium]